MLAAAERPWLRIQTPSAAEAAAQFAAPPPENGVTLWWGFDGPVNEEVIVRDLDRIKAMGFTSVMMEAGYGMKAKYLSPEWFALFKFTVAEARKRGLRLWIEDEGKYPSGFAGGKLSELRPDLRMQALAPGETIDVGGGETVTHTLPPETVSAVAYNLENETHDVLDIASGSLNWTAPAGRWEIVTMQHQFRTGVTRSVNNPTRAKDASASLCDYLNPGATRQIIAWTHEEYRKAAGEEFGGTFMGFMGDEPDYYDITPWTPKMLDAFQKRKGYDIRPYLRYVVPPERPRPPQAAGAPPPAAPLTEEQRRARADYWDVWSSVFAQNYFRVLADWCKANKVEYIVHLNGEDRNTSFVRGGGDFFKNMRSVAIPGIDAIWAQIWFDHEANYPKLASSAAHLFGRPHAFTESFAAFTHPVDVPIARWVIDYQLVRGINVIQVMFWSASSGRSPEVPPSGAGASTGGQGRRLFFETPEFPALARYVHRASYLLSMGRPTARIGMYMPTSSLWLGMGDNTAEAVDRIGATLAHQLLAGQRDFDWVDEQALSSVLKPQGGELRNLSGQGYRTIIVPGAVAMSRAALDRLRGFTKAGGHVVFVGGTPSMVVERTFLNAVPAPDLGWASVEPAAELTPRVLAALPEPDVVLDKPCASVRYQHRRLRDADVYFFFNEGEESQTRLATLAGSGQAQVWDAATGSITPIAGAVREGRAVRLPLTLDKHESRIVVLGPRPTR
jgi:hypothetical protein